VTQSRVTKLKIGGQVNPFTQSRISVIHNRQRAGTTQVSVTEEWVNKTWSLRGGILFSHEKE
jgi:hypothetical protein